MWLLLHFIDWYLEPVLAQISANVWHHFATKSDIDGLVQERCNSIALALEVCASCTKPSIVGIQNIELHIEAKQNFADIYFQMHFP